MKKKNKNILILEGNWDGYILEPKSSMRSLIDFVATNTGIEYSYNFINTPEEFKYILSTVDPRKFSLIYLGFHGDPEKIKMGINKEFVLTLNEISEIFSQRFGGYGVHFASCSVLETEPDTVYNFKNDTGLKFVSGYRKYVDFGDSSIVDLAFINAWIHSKNYNLMFQKLVSRHKTIMKENGFDYFV